MSRARLDIPTPRGPRAAAKFKSALGNLQRYARSTSRARTDTIRVRRSPRLRALRLRQSGMADSDSEYDDCDQSLNDGQHDHKHDDVPAPKSRQDSLVDTDADTLNGTDLSAANRSTHGYSFDETRDLNDSSYVDVGDDRDDVRRDPNWRRKMDQDSSAVGASQTPSQNRSARGTGLASFATPWTGAGANRSPGTGLSSRTPSSRSLSHSRSRSPSHSPYQSPRTVASILNSSIASSRQNSRSRSRSRSRSPLPPLPSPSMSSSSSSRRSRSEIEEVFEERTPSFLDRTKQYFRRVKPRQQSSFVDDADPGDSEYFRDVAENDDDEDDYFFTRHQRSMASTFNASVLFARSRVHNFTMALQQSPRKSVVVFGFGILLFVLAIFAWHSQLSAILSGGGGGFSWLQRIQDPQPIFRPIYPRDVEEQVLPLIQEAWTNNTAEMHEKQETMGSKVDETAQKLEELSAQFVSLVDVIERNHSDLVHKQEKMDTDLNAKFDDLRATQQEFGRELQSKLDREEFVVKIDELSTNIQQLGANLQHGIATTVAEQLKGLQQPQAHGNSPFNKEWTDRILEVEAKLESKLETSEPARQSEEEERLRAIVLDLQAKIQKIENGEHAAQVVEIPAFKQLEARLDEQAKIIQGRSDSLPMNYASGERGAKVVGFSSLFYPQKFFLQPLYDYFPVLGGYVWRRVTVDDKKARMVISDGWNCARFQQKPTGVFIEVALSDVVYPRSLTLAGRAPGSGDISPRGDLDGSSEVSAQPHMFSVFARSNSRGGSYDTLLDHAYYDRDGEVYQTFQLNNLNDRAYDTLKIVVHENYGNEVFTILYRVMVHGDPWR